MFVAPEALGVPGAARASRSGRPAKRGLDRHRREVLFAGKVDEAPKEPALRPQREAEGAPEREVLLGTNGKRAHRALPGHVMASSRNALSSTLA